MDNTLEATGPKDTPTQSKEHPNKYKKESTTLLTMNSLPSISASSPQKPPIGLMCLIFPNYFKIISEVYQSI